MRTTVTSEMKTDLLSVAILGNIAFSEGKQRIPYHDKELMKGGNQAEITMNKGIWVNYLHRK